MKIFDRVYLGDRFIARDPDFIRKNNINSIVNVTPSVKNYFLDPAVLDTFQLREEEELSAFVDDEEDDALDFLDDEDDLASDDVTIPSPSIIDDSHIVEKQESPVVDIFESPVTEPVTFEPIDDTETPIVVPKDFSIRYLRVPVDDSQDENLKKHFESIFKFIGEATSGTLVHCREARSRSVATIVAYGMYQHKMTLKESYEHIANLTMNNIRINEGFKRQLLEYEKDLFNVKENSMTFLVKRKRCHDYRELPDHKVSKQDFVRKRRQGILSVLVKPELGKVKMRQFTLFEILKIKADKVKKDEKKKKFKSTAKQTSLLSFFKKKE